MARVKRMIYILEADTVRRLLSMGIYDEARARMELHSLGPSPLLAPPTPVFGAIQDGAPVVPVPCVRENPQHSILLHRNWLPPPM